ncbi:MAG: hypothetical protein LBQ68_06230 [Clostridiales bacterium]|nr:hypothetical protein [Clostridiales bacterium]
MSNLRQIIIDRYVYSRADFNANLYNMVSNVLRANGYGYYVELFKEYGVKEYDLGVLGLISLCSYDFLCMNTAFFNRLKINAHIWNIHKLSESIDHYVEMFEIVECLIDCDLYEEECSLSDFSLSNNGELPEYFLQKKSYVKLRAKIVRDNIRLWRRYINRESGEK